ncbi:MAG: DUF3300 domain-containing protein [Reyranellaceae bacterium]
MCGAAVLAVLASLPALGRGGPELLAQAQPPAPAAKPFSTEELDQMLAPIALYPDALLSQVMMASTYPLEVVEAARWSKANPNLKGDAAVKAVQDKGWDVSVKSLVAFPTVVQRMSDEIEWTQKLGDAMLAQHTEVAGSIQRLRKRAYDAETLKTNEQQKVTVEPTPAAGGATQQTIVIEPANPQTIYVPVYQPTVVYGGWPYPSYPPYYYPPYPGYGYGAALATGFIWGAAIAGAGSFYGGWGWGNGDVDINIDRAVNIDRNFNRNNYQGGKWNHQPAHRKGVAYRDNASRQQYGRGAQGADARQQFRGKDVNSMARQGGQRPGGDRVGGGGAQQRPGGGDRLGGGGAQQRPGGGDRAGGGAQQRPGGGDRLGGGGAQQRPAQQNRGAFEGMDRGGQRTQREMSRGQSSISRGGGGGGRGGGGGGRGGGGRR